MRTFFFAIYFFGVMPLCAQEILLSAEPSACEGDTLFATALSDGFFFWNNGAKTESLAITTSGDYFYIYETKQGIINSDTLSILFTPNPLPVSNPQAESCFGAQDGAIEVFNTAGVPMANVLWSNGESGQAIFGLSPGVYEYTVFDTNGCSTTSSEVVGGPEEILLNLTLTETGSSVLIETNVSGGEAPYSFFWNKVLGEDSFNAESLPVSLSIVDDFNCSVDTIITLVHVGDMSLNHVQSKSVYYHHATQSLRLRNGAAIPKSIQVFNQQGSLIYTSEQPAFPIRLELASRVRVFWLVN
ncbi:MAG: hypothetical protein P8N19_05495 [Flavobacteriales bacterium]|nr:hypothetical protein [Flavobacteriales bacterium]MDG1765543.1 hypothetical protein [Flavobacteriales bacterium]